LLQSSLMKQFLIAAGVLFLVLLLVAGFFVYRIRRDFLRLGKMPKMPDDLRIARVVSGASVFSKIAFPSEPDLGLITDIQSRQNRDLIVVGQLGAAFLTENGSFRRNVHFERCDSDVVSVEVGAGAFLCRGTWSKGTMLFDSEGKTLWSFGGGITGVNDAAAGVLGAGGPQEVVIGLNGGGGVHLLGSDGKELWRQEDGNVWHVEIVAPDEKSGNVILHSNARGQLTVRDATGNVLARHSPEIYLAHFSLSAWRDDPYSNKLVAVDKDSVYVLAMDGNTLARLPVPGNTGIPDPKGTTVHSSEDGPDYAVLLRHRLWARSLLYIYDAKDQLIYNEILDRDCAALRAVPGQNGAEDLLLGCDGTVEKYSLSR